MKLSVIIPAYNEEKYLAATLEQIEAALAATSQVEVIVVDNDSTDGTRVVAGQAGVQIVSEDQHNIARVRNTGARSAAGEILVFVDADTLVQPGLFEKIVEVMADETCLGGSVAVVYGVAKKKWIRYYLLGWQYFGRLFRMRQGAAQFCGKSAFDELGGYDESIYLGEDVEFQWRLSKLAHRRGGHTTHIKEPSVLTSPRRYSEMGLAKTLVLTHPITLLLAWRRSSMWKDWYENAIR